MFTITDLLIVLLVMGFGSYCMSPGALFTVCLLLIGFLVHRRETIAKESEKIERERRGK